MSDERHEDDGVEVLGSGAIEAISRAEVDIQIKTAKTYPRSIEKFKKDALTLATMDTETARGCFYMVPRDNREIEGASIRFAEIAASCYGNIQYGGRIISEDDRFIVAQGMAFDLEKNLRVSIEVRRRITDKNGRRYRDDMIITTSNAAISIALRNAIFRIVPMALTKSIMDEVKKVSLGKGLTMEERRANVFKYFGTLNAKEDEVLLVIRRRGKDDITVEDLIRLNGMRTAIEDGDITWKQILEDAIHRDDPDAGAKPRTASEILKDTKAKGEPQKTEGAETKSDSAAGGEPKSDDPPHRTDEGTASGGREPGDESTVDDFVASVDPISPDQQRALLNSIGSARLTPNQLTALCKKYNVPQITAINVGQFRELSAELAAGKKPF